MGFSRQQYWSIVGNGCHFLLQEGFLTLESNPSLLCLLHWQMDSLPLSHMESPRNLFSSSSVGQKSKIEVLAEMLLLEALKENLFLASLLVATGNTQLHQCNLYLCLHLDFSLYLYRSPPFIRTNIISESEVTQSSLTLCNPVEGSLPGSAIHGIFQARILEWAAISFSKSH